MESPSSKFSVFLDNGCGNDEESSDGERLECCLCADYSRERELLQAAQAVKEDTADCATQHAAGTSQDRQL